ncbi:tyrosine-type recombinase/integrase [Kribbella sp. CA-245084]|uniref:tyrosine-type recombinase/integrase n=1 Tax=Kribbella sp. CA-245084 TaxID=3239940 RepID=UPI003D8FF9C9
MWHDPNGEEKSQAFDTKVMAVRHANAIETDSARGQYVDPKAGQVRFADLAARWLASRIVDPNTAIKYESSLRLHVNPVFGRRQLGSIKPSEIATWVADLESRFGPGTARNAFIVLNGPLELAVDDEAIKRNPATAGSVRIPIPRVKKVAVWADEVVLRIVEEHPASYRPIPIVGAAAGLRQGELFGLAEEDIDFDEEVIHVRRQVKKLGKHLIFALPKNDKERTVPMSEGAAEVLRAHIGETEPRPHTLPWERVDGPPLTVKLLFRWRDDLEIHARGYDEYVWKPALAHAGVIPMPTRNARHDLKYVTNRDVGMHALRHYYASVSLADGVNIKELAEYLGHTDPGFTLRLYTHLLPSSHERSRKAIDNRLSPLFSIAADGTDTELGLPGL